MRCRDNRAHICTHDPLQRIIIIIRRSIKGLQITTTQLNNLIAVVSNKQKKNCQKTKFLKTKDDNKRKKKKNA